MKLAHQELTCPKLKLYTTNMQKHIKIYFDHFGYSQDEYISCENECGRRGGHIHHITPRSQGGKDIISNLACLCETCHHQIHFGQGVDNEKVREKHLRLLGIEKATISDDEQQ
jgi:5-methylcytosine-specific restriction endonuclease McrA